MSSSTQSLKFLLDENVRRELFRFLKDNAFDIKLVPKSASDKQVALFSKTEKRILVTNEEFNEYTKDQVFSVVWLRIAQNDPVSLLASFERLLKGVKDFSGKLVALNEKGWDEVLLYEELDL